MKTVNIYLEDTEHELLLMKKGSKTWKEYLMDLKEVETK
jgi:hypothetical protein